MLNLQYANAAITNPCIVTDYKYLKHI